MAYRIKELRKQHGWTQDELAELVGCSKSHVSEMEAGKKKPSNPMMVALAEAFRVPITSLFDGADEAKEAALAQFERLSPKAQEQALAYMQFLLSQDQSSSGGSSTPENQNI